MKTIKIFLASSDEMENDRMAFGNLVRRLDKIYEKRGIRVELFEWEDYDASMTGQRKQDEYNDQIKASDLFLALFHTRAGNYTIEEFNVATEEFRMKASPKVYVYCRDLQQGETESPELTEFKKRLFDEMGHYWCRYGNRDTMQLHFVMQLQLVESNRMDALKVEENGAVTIDGTPIARMDQLSFAAGNESYQKMSEELQELPDKIEKARERLKKFPDDEDLRDDLQSKLNRYNQLKEDFAKLQQDLFSTAKTIATLQLQQVGVMLRRAIEAFESGNLAGANALLEEIAHEAEHHMERLEQDRALVHQDIEAFQLQAKTVMADVNIPIAERIERVAAIYAKADDWAQRSAYDKEKYVDLLMEYVEFWGDNAHYKEAEIISRKVVAMTEDVYGTHHVKTATVYYSHGSIYAFLGNYNKALEFLNKALSIQNVLDNSDKQEELTVTETLNSIALVYHMQGNFHSALELSMKALRIREETVGCDDFETARLYNNIGGIYDNMGDFDKALEFYNKALEYRERELGKVHTETAVSYNNLGVLNFTLNNYDKSIEYLNKALSAQETLLGTEHTDTALTYFNLGLAFYNLNNNVKARKYIRESIRIREKVLGTNHPDTARSYNALGLVFQAEGNKDKALEYFNRALHILEKALGNHPDIQVVKDNIKSLNSSKGGFWSWLLGD